MRQIKSEDPIDAWPVELINVKDRIVLDLGCGFFGMTHRFEEGTMEWDKKPLPNMISTSEHWINLGAKKVYGFDINADDIECLRKRLGPTGKAEFFNEGIGSAAQIEELIQRFGVDVVKSDIEGAETVFFGVKDNIFRMVKEYYMETHNPSVHNVFLNRFHALDYEIKEIIAIGENVEMPPFAIFAVRKDTV